MAAAIEHLLGEASWLLSHAEALGDYGRRDESAAEIRRAALCEEQVACLLESAGRTAGVATPAISSLLGVFGALLGRDLTGGRALDHLGLGDLTRREVVTFFHEGWEGHPWSRVIR